MPVYFHRPENALNRAKEFIDVGKNESALEVLSDVIRSKKHRQWSDTHESIMRLFLRLCIDLQRSASAKDGLYQYRNICKDANLNSFQNIIGQFLDQAEGKASTARKESEQTVLDIEDLDMIQTPESLLLSTVSGEDTQDRTDRILLTPWVKFLWESFRNILELLKNNSLMERIYTDVAKRAFKFCLEYKRRTEFHKLCDILRTHLRYAQEHQQVQNSLKFDVPDTIHCLVDVRFEQLDKAISIDLWQEAFRAIEDIHSLISGPRQKAKASLLENFYQKQASVYWMANNKLFHAAALYRLFVLRKEQKKTFSLESEEAKKTASQVLLATLAVPIEPVPSGIDGFLVVDYNTQDRSRRLSALLRMQTPPTRASLLKELCHHGVLQCVFPQLQQLYTCLEVEFNPLHLCAKVAPLLEQLEANKETSQYVESLKEVTLVRLIKQIAQVYQSIQLSRLSELALFATPMELERLVVLTAKKTGIQVKIDHITQSLWFGTDIDLSQHVKTGEGPVVQPMPSEVFCDHLSIMAQALQQAANLVFSKEIEFESSKKYMKAVQRCRENEQITHKTIAKRKKAIEERKEYLENVQKEKDKAEKEKVDKMEAERREEQKKKLDEDLKKEEDEKKKKDIADMKKKMAEDKLEALKKTPLGARAFATVTADDLKDLDPNGIMVKQLQQMEKEKRDKDTKLKGQEKKIDYFERAKCLVEIPLLKQQYKEQIEYDKQFHEEQEEERVKKAILEREEAEKLKKRMLRMEGSKLEFLEIIKEKRNIIFMEKMSCYQSALDEEREKRLEKRKLERMLKRRAEAAAVEKSERERKARAAAEMELTRKKEEQRIHEEKMEQSRIKQLEREREVEEKRKRKEEEQRQKEEERMREKRDLVQTRPDADNWRREHREDSPPVRRRDAYRPPQRHTDDWRQSEPDRRERDQEQRGGWDRERRGRDYSPRGGGSWREERERGDDRFWRDDRGGQRDDREGYGRRQDDRGDREPDRYRSRDSDRYEGGRDRDRYPDRDSDRYRDRDQDRYRSRDSDRYRDLDQYRERNPDRYRDQDRYRDRDRDRGGGGEWRRTSPDRRDMDDRPRRGYDRTPRRDEGRERDTWVERRELSPPRRREERPDSSPRMGRRDVSPRQGRDEGGEDDGWEKVTRRR